MKQLEKISEKVRAPSSAATAVHGEPKEEVAQIIKQDDIVSSKGPQVETMTGGLAPGYPLDSVQLLLPGAIAGAAGIWSRQPVRLTVLEHGKVLIELQEEKIEQPQQPAPRPLFRQTWGMSELTDEIPESKE